MSSELLITGGLAVLLLKITLVLTLSLIWARALGSASASTRHLLWLTTLSLLLAVPLVSTAVPSLRVVPVPFAAAEKESPDAFLSGLPRPAFDAPEAEAPIGSTSAAPAAMSPSRSARVPAFEPGALVTLLLALWGAGSALLLGRLAISAVALRRALRQTTPLTGAEWSIPLCEAADRLDLADIPVLVLSEEAAMPFACGFRRPTIVLPAAARQWDAGRRRAVLFHELAHIRRRDLVGHTVARLVCALYWIHPMVWTAARRLRAESERACDDLALSVGIRASEYADHLLQIVSGVRASRSPAVALPFAERRELEGRVLAILDPVLHRGRPSTANFGAVAALLLCGIVFSALAPAVGAPTAAAADPAGELPAANLAGQSHPAPAAAQPEPAAAGSDRLPTVAQALAVDAGADEADAPARPRTLSLEQEIERHVLAAAETTVGLGLFGGKKASATDVPMLANALATDPSPLVRRTAAWSLSDFDSPAATAALARALLTDQDVSVREMSAWALEDDRGATGAAALVQALGRDASEKVRGTAAWAIGNNHDRSPAALSALDRALGDAATGVRQRAAWAIGSIEPSTAPPALYRSLLGDPSSSVRAAAVWALSQIGDPRASDALLSRLDHEPRDDIARAISRALLLTSPRSPEALERLLRSPSEDVRAHAIAAAAGAKAPFWPWPWPWPDPRPMP